MARCMPLGSSGWSDMRAALLAPTTSQLTLWSSDTGKDDWVVRQSARARRLSVRVLRSGRVEVVVPRRVSAQQVENFVSQHREWIERQRAQAKRRAPPPEPFPPQRIELAACAEAWRIHLTGGAGRTRVSQ